MLASASVLAHGSVSMEDDACKLRVGRYLMHFTGFQPETASGPKEFCEDIPEAANTIIVLDYIDSELRDLPTEVRIVRAEAQGKDLQGATVFHLPPKRYPTGSLSLETRLDEGDYIGLVTVEDKQKLVARFPFAVGKRSHAWQVLLIAVPVAAVALYYFGMRQRRRARPVA